MSECELIGECPFYLGKLAEKPVEIEELKKKYCHGNNLSCARCMIIQSLGEAHIPPDLYPHEKIVAYTIIAENSST